MSALTGGAKLLQLDRVTKAVLAYPFSHAHNVCHQPIPRCGSTRLVFLAPATPHRESR